MQRPERRVAAPSTFEPGLRSLALRDIPHPDFAEVQIIPLPAGAPVDPRIWAQAIFDVRHGPRWVLALLMLRQAVVGLIGIERAGPDVFVVDEVVGEEALIVSDHSHLDFRAAVAVDADAGLVRLTTTVRIHGWRGRLYFLPVRFLHSPVTFAMLRRAASRL